MTYPDIPWETRWALIKNAIETQGTSLTELGKREGVSGIATTKRKRYPAGQTAIGKFLGVTPACLFPERYKAEWTEQMQREVEKALPGLLGGIPGKATAGAILNQQVEEYRQHPIDLTDLPTFPKERNNWILAQLKLRDYNLSSIANHLGIKRTTLHNLSNVAYFDVQAYLATCLGVAPHDLWPDRYNKEGEPLAVNGPPLLSPGRHAPHQLDLSEGLWLPIDALVGLPGMPSSDTGIQSMIRGKGQGVRERIGVIEVVYSTLPEETQFFLTGNADDDTTPKRDPVPQRQRKRAATRTVQLHEDQEGRRYALQIDVLAKDARLTAICLDPTSQTFINFQALDMTVSELREAATALIEAAQMLEVGSDAS